MGRLGDIFRTHGSEYRRRFGDRMSLDQLRAVRAVEKCHTPAAGSALWRCKSCGHSHFTYQGCGNRHCPSCGGTSAAEWLRKQCALLLPGVTYHLVTFTVPDHLRRVVRSNPRELLDLLVRTSSSTLLDICGNPEWVGGVPGVTAVLHTWTRLRYFIVRAGKVIVLAVLVLGILNSLGTDGSFGNEDTENSVLAVTGKAITPIFSPMGIQQENWPATVGLFTGLFAKEAVVGTLNGLYGQIAASEIAAEESGLSAGEGEEEEPFSLIAGIAESFEALIDGVSGISGGIGTMVGADIVGGEESEVAEAVEADISVFSLMRRNFTGASGYAYLLFVLIYFPCLAAFGAAAKEMGLGLGALQAAYLTIR